MEERAQSTKLIGTMDVQRMFDMKMVDRCTARHTGGGEGSVHELHRDDGHGKRMKVVDILDCPIGSRTPLQNHYKPIGSRTQI